MKDVKFTRDMAPHKAGERRIVPDDVADRLVEDGDAEDVRPFPADGDVQSEKPRRPANSGRRPNGNPAASYVTKDGAK